MFDFTRDHSFAACSSVKWTTGNIHDFRIQGNTFTICNIMAYKLNQKVGKVEIKFSKIHEANSRSNKPWIKHFPIHLTRCLMITPALWHHEIFLKCSMMSTPQWYISINLINETSDFHEIFEFRRCYPLQLSFNFKSIGTLFRGFKLVHKLLGKPCRWQ